MASEGNNFTNSPLTTETGKSIGHEELFAYTNGRFLVDEQRQLERRYVKFDVDALCDVSAAAGPDPSLITAIEKMEGGFSKAFLMKWKNGTEVIVKLPCRNAGPPKLTTASEVAILRYSMCHSRVEGCHLNLRNNSKTQYGPSSARCLLMEL